MKKISALMLTATFILSIASTTFAAPSPDYDKEIASLKAQLAALEKSVKTKVDKSDVKLDFNGSDMRLRYVDDKTKDDSVFSNRVRLNMNYKINDNLLFNARWRVANEVEPGSHAKDYYMLSDLNMNVKNAFGWDGTTMTAGRFSQNMLANGYWMSTTIGLIDGVKFTNTNKNLQTTFGFANFGALGSKDNANIPSVGDAWFINAKYDTSKNTSIYAMKFKETYGSNKKATVGDGSNYDVWGLGINTKISDDWSFQGDYTDNTAQPNGTGYYTSLRWKGATKTPGSWGLRLDYRNIKSNNMINWYSDYSATSSNIPQSNSKGPAISAHWTVAPNTLFEAFQTFNSKVANTDADKANYTRAQVTFSF